MIKPPIAAVVVGLGLAACPAAFAQPGPAPAPAPGGGGQPTWKQVFENSQTVYYIGQGGAPAGSTVDLSSLLEFKIPQVVNATQIWSIVAHLKVNCAAKQMITVDNTLYAGKMGAGKAVSVESGSDNWHTPQHGSLGELIWTTACASK